MLDIILRTNPKKIYETFNPRGLKAGILYNNDGEAIDKILFYEKMGYAKEVFNDICYPLDKESYYYIDDIIYIDELFIDFFGYGDLSLLQLYMGYKMFLNDTNYLYRHLEDFGMFEREVGYKGKTEIVPDPYFRFKSRQNLFMALIKIINYKEINYKDEEKFEIPTIQRK